MAGPLSVIAGAVGIKVSPVLTGFSNDLEKKLKGMRGSGQKAGKDLGQGVNEGFDTEVKKLSDKVKVLGQELGRAQAKNEQATSRATVADAALTAARDKLSVATARVDQAEQKVNDLRKNGGSAKQIEAAEKALVNARLAVSNSTANLVRHEENHKNAMSGAAAASRAAKDADIALGEGKRLLAEAMAKVNRNNQDGERHASAASRAFGVLGRTVKDSTGAVAGGAFAFTAIGTVLSSIVPLLGAATVAVTGLGLAFAGLAAGFGVVLMLATPMIAAFQAQTAAENETARNSQESAAKRADAARQVKEAENGVTRAKIDAARQIKEANRAVEDAEKALSDTEKQTKQDIVDAQRQIADATSQSAETVRSALEREREAHERLADTQRNAATAQRDLITAQKEAAAQIDELNDRVAEGSNNEERAQIAILRAKERLEKMNGGNTSGSAATMAQTLSARAAVESAQNAYNKAMSDSKATQLSKQAAADRLAAAQSRQDALAAKQPTTTEYSDVDRREAALNLKEAEDQLKRIRKENAQNAKEKADADAKGVNGSDRVRQAIERIAEANRSVGKAQAEVAKAGEQYRKAEADGARAIADAKANLARVEASSADQVAQAQRRLSDEQERAREVATDSATKIAEAQARLANQMDKLANPEKVTSVQQKYQQALDNLSPAGQRFLLMLKGMQQGWVDISKVAQEAAFPGIINGFKAAGSAAPEFTNLVKAVAGELGVLAQRVGEAFGSPQGRHFLQAMSEILPRAMRQGFEILSNLGRGIGTFFAALTPAGLEFNDILVNLTKNFADWMEKWTKSEDFKNFVKYLKQNLPVVGKFLKEFWLTLVGVAKALAPLGQSTLQHGTQFLKWLNDLSKNQGGGFIAAAAIGAIGAALIRLSPLVSILSGVVRGLMAIGLVPALIIVGIVALIAVVVACYIKFEWFRNGINQIWEQIKNKAKELWPTIKETWNSITDFLKVVWERLKWAWSLWGDNIKAVGKSFLDNLTNLFKGFFQVIKGLFDIFTGLFTGDWSKFWNGLKSVGEGFANMVKAIFKFLWDTVKEIFKGFWKWVLQKWDEFKANLKVIIQAFNKMVSDKAAEMQKDFHKKVDDLVSGVKQKWNDFTKGIHDLMDRLGDGIRDRWAKIKGYFKDPINAVIGFVNDPFIKGLNAIGSKIGMEQIQTLTPITQLYTGGTVPGPKPNGEYDNTWGMVAGKAPVTLAGGEMVIRNKSTDSMNARYPGMLDRINREGADAFRSMGAPGYAEGGLVAAFLQKMGSRVGQMYLWGGGHTAAEQKNPNSTRFDCSGLGLWAETQIGVPHTGSVAWDMGQGGTRMSVDQGLKTPGAYLYNNHHIAYSLGNGQIIEAPQTGKPVRVTSWRQSMDHASINPALTGSLTPEQLKALQEGGGFSMWDWAKGKASEALSWLSSEAGKAVVALLDPLAEQAKNGLGALLPDTPWISGMTKKMGQGLIDKGMGFLQEKVNSWAATEGGGIGDAGDPNAGDARSYVPPGGVQAWANVFRDALKRTGQSEAWLNAGLRRLAQESSGNQYAQNNTDSNARRGTPSKGLMQVIDPTFQAYRDPTLPNNIWDPLANIVASIRYTIARYGNLNGWNRAGGYAHGGLVDPGNLPSPELWDINVGDIAKLNPGPTMMYNNLGKNEYLKRVDPKHPEGPVVQIAEFHAHENAEEAIDRLAFSVRTHRFAGVYN